MDKVCKRITEIVLFAGVTAGAVACDSTGSANPLSPHIAGPLAGVTITAPTLLEPADGAFIKATSQPPLLIVFTNASSNSPRSFVHQLEIATVSDFSQVLFSADDIPPGPDGKASYDVPEALAPEVYYLRVRALDGANTGPYSNPARVEVYAPGVLETPTPLSPIGGGTITTTKPALVVQHGAATGSVDSIDYLFEIASDSGFTNVVARLTVPQSPETTTSATPNDLAADSTFYWRAHTVAHDKSGEVTSPYSTTESFRTPPLSPAPSPAPSPGPAAGDELDLSKVTFLHANVSGWAVTSTVLSVSISSTQVCVNHTKTGQWPTSEPFGPGVPIEGNPWIFAFINGQWYGATWDWLRVGQVCKSVTAEEFGRDQIRIYPMDRSWVPKKGDQIGCMMSTRARDRAGSAGTERSNVVLTTWPY